jgi:malonate transporter
MSVALALLPDFTLILLGATLRRLLHLGDHFWSGVEKLVYFVLFPALLFNGLVRTRIDWSAAGPLIAVAAATMLAGMLLGLGARSPIFGLSPRAFASQHQCAFRFNSYIALAIAGSLYGSPGIAAMAIVVGVMVPPANMVAVFVLAHHGEQKVLRELARNPLIIGTVAGLLANVAGLQLPEVLLKLLARLGDGAVVLGLLAVGAGLRFGVLKVSHGEMASPLGTASPSGTAPSLLHPGAAAYLLTVKLLAMPLVAWWLARVLELPPLYAHIVLVFAALPVASSAFILAQRMGGDGASVAWLISTSTLLAMVTLPAWLSLSQY